MQAIDITLQKREGHYIIHAPGMRGARLFVTHCPYRDDGSYLLELPGDKAEIPDTFGHLRPYFILRAEDSSVLVGDRRVDVPGVENFREQGGYPTQCGRSVKWGRFFRGGPLAIAKEDQEALEALGLRTILDYRGAEESMDRPDHVPHGAAYRLVPAGIDKSMGKEATDYASFMDVILSAGKQTDVDAVYGRLCDSYRQLPFRNPAYTALFEALDSEDAVPLHQHCSAGKDRTGLGGALLLLCLGVSREIVMEDYLLTNAYREETNRRFIDLVRPQAKNPFSIVLLQQMMSVTRQMLQSAFDAIDARYPSFSTFLREEYDIMPDRLAHWRALHLA